MAQYNDYWWNAGDRGAQDVYQQSGGENAFAKSQQLQDYLRQSGTWDALNAQVDKAYAARQGGPFASISRDEIFKDYLRSYDPSNYGGNNADLVRNREGFADARESFFRNWMGNVYKGTAKEGDYNTWKDRGLNALGAPTTTPGTPAPAGGQGVSMPSTVTATNRPSLTNSPMTANLPGAASGGMGMSAPTPATPGAGSGIQALGAGSFQMPTKPRGTVSLAQLYSSPGRTA